LLSIFNSGRDIFYPIPVCKRGKSLIFITCFRSFPKIIEFI
jgi:hypothetical protein